MKNGYDTLYFQRANEAFDFVEGFIKSIKSKGYIEAPLLCDYYIPKNSIFQA